MKTVKRLNTEDKSDCYVTNMMSINDFDPKLLLINEFISFENGSIMFDINYCKQNNTPYVVFNNIEYVFKRSCVFSYLIFRETEKQKYLYVYLYVYHT